MYLVGSKFIGQCCIAPSKLGQLLAHEAIQRQHLQRVMGPESSVQDAGSGNTL